ncbi:MAG: Ig-like domain-containing protein, partial [Alphaproteobacteria bacterium]|nr:Ig-like domain-containing protein [Alphaproteobacteria bacterium]
YVGSETLAYTITDGFESVSGSFTIEVVNDPPVANADSYTTGFGDVLTVDAATGVLANDTDADGDALSVLSFQQSSLGVVNMASDGSFTFTPDAGASGSETLTYTISDGAETATATFEITVEADTGPNIIQGTDIGFENLSGTSGDDEIRSGGGAFDAMFGGAGSDTFVFEGGVGDGRQTMSIADYTPGEDRIDLGGQGVLFDFSFGSATYIYLDGGDFDLVIANGASSIDDITFV